MTTSTRAKTSIRAKTIGISIAVGLLLTGMVTGCGKVQPAPAPMAYGREGPAIGLARVQRQEQRSKQAPGDTAHSRRIEVVAATQAAVAEAMAKDATAGQIKHVVVMWLKKPGDAAARQALLEAGRTFKTIPGVLDVAVGEVLPSDRAVVDSTYDVAFVVTFADAQSLQAYGPHPVHQKAVEEVVKPNVERFLVYDFTVK